jgi:hypothetical protein
MYFILIYETLFVVKFIFIHNRLSCMIFIPDCDKCHHVKVEKTFNISRNGCNKYMYAMHMCISRFGWHKNNAVCWFKLNKN